MCPLVPDQGLQATVRWEGGVEVGMGGPCRARYVQDPVLVRSGIQTASRGRAVTWSQERGASSPLACKEVVTF